MKKIVILIVAGCCTLLLNAQQLIQANNATIVTSPSTRVVIKGGVSFNGSSVLKDSGTIYISADPAAGRENWTDNVSGSVFHSNSRGTVVFNAGTRQELIGAGNFYNLQVRADSGISITNSINIRNNLLLDTGLVFLSGANNISIDNPSVNAIQSSSAYSKSYIIGKLTRAANDNSSEYLFPIGKIKGTDSLYAPVKFKKGNTGLVNYNAEYFPEIPYDRFNFLSPPIDHISEVEYWEITSDNNSNDDALLSLSWRTYSNVSSLSSSRDSMLIAHYNDNNGLRWQPEMNIASLNTVSGNVNFGYVTSNTGVIDFSPAYPYFTLASRSPFGILPVQLLSFTGMMQDKKTRLNWKVASNEQALSFEVFKSVDNIHFSSIGTVTARNITGIANYELLDNNPSNGWNYYKLKLLSKDNSVAYSDILKFYAGNDSHPFKLYPNPATDFTTLAVPANGKTYTVRIIDLNGKVIDQKNSNASTLRLDLKQLTQGKYFVQVIQEGTSTSIPLLKL